MLALLLLGGLFSSQSVVVGVDQTEEEDEFVLWLF